MKNVYIETYGCILNISDSEVIMSMLKDHGYCLTFDMEEADIIILNSCSIREDGHNKIWERLNKIEESEFSGSVIITGCFASLIQDEVFKKHPVVKAIVNPNSYRKIVDVVSSVLQGNADIKIVNMDNREMYEEISPYRFMEYSTAAIPIMKGCNQVCTYCIESYTRGRERCRSPKYIIQEVKKVLSAGYREITLVGQIIDKYKWIDDTTTIDFADILKMVAEACPDTRIKFLSSHPTYFSDKIIDTILNHRNIMRVVHLPVQSGSDRILKLMNRGYDRKQYTQIVRNLRSRIPDISIITDIMVGFCTESEKDFAETCSLIEELEFDDYNVFRFSMRSHTIAYKTLSDDVTEEIKIKRSEVVEDIRSRLRLKTHRAEIGKELSVLVETHTSKSSELPLLFCGRDMRHRNVTFEGKGCKEGDIVKVKIVDASSDEMIGILM